ncbi:MAG: hypothetical protein IJ776_05045 [Paludibacteraceae bacterium]|nr:hypothetical protein [Paludibacteraceae bacterium]
MQRFDKYWIGILVGLLMPALFGYLYIDRMNLWYTLQTFGLKSMAGLIGKLTVVSIFPDAALFFLFYTTDTWRLAKGVLIGALPYMLAALCLAI